MVEAIPLLGKIKVGVAASPPEERFNVLLKCLRSTNLAFDIFKFLETLKALLILRALSRKGMQFSQKFH